jgi:hypothetical protein
MSPISLSDVAAAINKIKSHLIGNGMEKVLIEAIKLFEKLPENERTAERLREILNVGIEKKFDDRKIILKLTTQ